MKTPEQKEREALESILKECVLKKLEDALRRTGFPNQSILDLAEFIREKQPRIDAAGSLFEFILPSLYQAVQEHPELFSKEPVLKSLPNNPINWFREEVPPEISRLKHQGITEIKKNFPNIFIASVVNQFWATPVIVPLEVQGEYEAEVLDNCTIFYRDKKAFLDSVLEKRMDFQQTVKEGSKPEEEVRAFYRTSVEDYIIQIFVKSFRVNELMPTLKDLVLSTSILHGDFHPDLVSVKWVNPARSAIADHEITIAKTLQEHGIPTVNYGGFIDFGGVYFLIMQGAGRLTMEDVFYTTNVAYYLDAPNFPKEVGKICKKATVHKLRSITRTAYEKLGRLAARVEKAPVHLPDLYRRNVAVNLETGEPELILLDFEKAEHSGISSHTETLKQGLEKLELKAYEKGYEEERGAK